MLTKNRLNKIILAAVFLFPLVVCAFVLMGKVASYAQEVETEVIRTTPLSHRVKELKATPNYLNKTVGLEIKGGTESDDPRLSETKATTKVTLPISQDGVTEELCGDGLCDINENFTDCPADCKELCLNNVYPTLDLGDECCGNGICADTEGEGVCTCPEDCPFTPDDGCDPDCFDEPDPGWCLWCEKCYFNVCFIEGGPPRPMRLRKTAYEGSCYTYPYPPGGVRIIFE